MSEPKDSEQQNLSEAPAKASQKRVVSDDELRSILLETIANTNVEEMEIEESWHAFAVTQNSVIRFATNKKHVVFDENGRPWIDESHYQPEINLLLRIQKHLSYTNGLIF